MRIGQTTATCIYVIRNGSNLLSLTVITIPMQVLHRFVRCRFQEVKETWAKEVKNRSKFFIQACEMTILNRMNSVTKG